MIASTALPRWYYGDTETVTIRKQEEAAAKEKACGACGACSSRITFHWKGEEYIGCDKKRRTYGRRCELFKRKKEQG